MSLFGIGRYGVGARAYDLLSFEYPVYRIGREHGIDLLRLKEGNQVLDLGCGTGLNFPLLRAATGETGRIVGVDASASMLGRAAARVRRNRWSNVDLHHGDAANLDWLDESQTFDAALFTYSLSIIADWQSAWEQVRNRLRPGGRVVVVDLALPSGVGTVLRPLAELACFTGGSDPHRAPWTALLEDTVDTFEEDLRFGHIHVAAGTRIGQSGDVNT